MEIDKEILFDHFKKKSKLITGIDIWWISKYIIVDDIISFVVTINNGTMIQGYSNNFITMSDYNNVLKYKHREEKLKRILNGKNL